MDGTIILSALGLAAVLYWVGSCLEKVIDSNTDRIILKLNEIKDSIREVHGSINHRGAELEGVEELIKNYIYLQENRLAKKEQNPQHVLDFYKGATPTMRHNSRNFIEKTAKQISEEFYGCSIEEIIKEYDEPKIP